jgi:hypothetical protein
MTTPEHDGNLPLIAEVLGPPGSGKTTLLTELDRRIELVEPVSGYRGLRQAPSYARGAASVAPVVLASLATTRPSRKELNWMIRLAASSRVAATRAAAHPADGPTVDRRIVLFAQGPAYTLARLWEATLAPSRGGAFARWWDAALDRWARALGVVVLLDAPDHVLLDRIRDRGKPHAAKELPDEEALRALAGSRASCEAVLAALAARGGPRVLRFDSSRLTLDEIAAAAATTLRAAAALGAADDPPASVASAGTELR